MSLLLAVLLAQGMTADAGAWTVAGPTTFLDASTFRASLKVDGALVVDSSLSTPTIITTVVYANTVLPPLDEQGVVLTGRRNPWDTGSTGDVAARSYSTRYAGNVFDVWNDWTLLGGVTYRGETFSGIEGSPAAFTDMSAASNHVSLRAHDGLEVVLEGRLPERYWGRHGNFIAFAEHPMMAGYLASFVNPTDSSGAATNEKLMVTYQGGLYPGGQYNRDQFAPCGEYENAPANDGGPGYYIATDAGVAHRGTKQWAADLQQWLVCCVPVGDRAGCWRDERVGCTP